jgi:NADH:ubiquinone oxidoreductase subunit 5 (subunit L)/multisubunit Na+/H+ antiporter MnhA subunit/multisubunit Na+/H+ antiporter MnhB subunit
MNDTVLLLPLLFTILGAVLAALFSSSTLQKKVSMPVQGWLVGLTPLAAFVYLFWQLERINAGEILQLSIPWIAELGISFALYLDGLSILFGLIISGIGVLVIVYAGYYFTGDSSAWRFLAYMMLFMTSMLGTVMAGDVILMFVFWEGTSITSYLLIGYKYKDEAARRGAFKALFITAGGGIPLLAGLIIVSSIAGGTDLATILSSGDLLRSSPLYLVMLALVAFGAFTKSAQTPAHIWLPDAMTAPTPASAYLHSATMVKAGIYLMARLNPALGNTEAWFWLLSLVGLATMVTGAYLGLKQNDLKALLAYSTISQLGALMMLIGQDTAEAFKALIIGILAHALYKSALFLTAGIVDHETGTRDLRRLGNLYRIMPFTFGVGLLASLSMAGLPPLFGFLAKETLLVTVVHESAPQITRLLFTGAALFTGALLLAQSLMLLFDTFLGQRKDASLHPHEAPIGMWLAPAIPAVLSLAVGVLPEPAWLATFLARAAGAAYGSAVSVSLALWHGINIPLILSLIAITVGLIIFYHRFTVRGWQAAIDRGFTYNAWYQGALNLVDSGAFRVTRTQNGYLRQYLVVMLLGMAILIGLFRALPAVSLAAVTWPDEFLSMATLIFTFRISLLSIAVIAAFLSITMERDLPAVLALGASGLAVALVILVEPAPDVALVQIVVDVLSVVILILTLTRLPRPQRERAFDLNVSRVAFPKWDLLVALGSFAVVSLVTFVALTSRPRESLITPLYEANALLLGTKDIVGAILVDFRALDTLIEVAVFSMAGIGAYTLIQYASRTAGDKVESPAVDHKVKVPLRIVVGIKGIGGQDTSSLLHGLAYVSLPLAVVLAAVHIMFGHDQPGDGFTAGVLISLAVGFWYVVFGYNSTKEQLGHWLKPTILVGAGLMLIVVSGVSAFFLDGNFLGHVDYGKLIGIDDWLPGAFHLSTALLFELAIALAVLGGATAVIDALGRPQENTPDLLVHLENLTILASRGEISIPEQEQWESEDSDWTASGDR